ncbi:Uma2 family endonuclease [Candidatus Poribacteria bacterium]|nr:Uma2 family endonuclease [Candidatus Poribacteria bacterium]
MAQTAAVAKAQKQRTVRSRKSTEIVDLFPRQGQWTEADYLALPETNRIIELSEGRVVMPDMPTTSHQRTVIKLLRLMSDHVEAQGLGEVCVAPLRVHLWPGKFREPDIVFMHRNHADRIGEDYWGIPDLVVEIISPRTTQSSGTENVDRGEKFVEYAKAGVKEYWLIHPTACTIEVYVLKDGVYHLLDRWGKGEVARSEVLGGFEVPVEVVMQGGE